MMPSPGPIPTSTFVVNGHLEGEMREASFTPSLRDTYSERAGRFATAIKEHLTDHATHSARLSTSKAVEEAKSLLQSFDETKMISPSLLDEWEKNPTSERAVTLLKTLSTNHDDSVFEYFRHAALSDLVVCAERALSRGDLSDAAQFTGFSAAIDAATLTDISPLLLRDWYQTKDPVYAHRLCRLYLTDKGKQELRAEETPWSPEPEKKDLRTQPAPTSVQKEEPVWREVLRTPVRRFFTKKDIVHGGLTGSALEFGEAAITGIVDKLAGLLGALTANNLTFCLLVAGSWFWQGTAGVTRQFSESSCGDPLCNEDHGTAKRFSGSAKQGSFLGRIAGELSTRTKARMKELASFGSRITKGLVAGGSSLVHWITHPRSSARNFGEKLRSGELFQEIGTTLHGAGKNCLVATTRALPILLPVIGHKLTDNAGIILGHTLFAAVGLPPWLGGICGNVLFSMPYHVAEAAIRGRVREVLEERAEKRREALRNELANEWNDLV